MKTADEFEKVEVGEVCLKLMEPPDEKSIETVNGC